MLDVAILDDKNPVLALAALRCFSHCTFVKRLFVPVGKNVAVKGSDFCRNISDIFNFVPLAFPLQP
jgi:hypothetical protein